jgi:hypothetical protein
MKKKIQIEVNENITSDIADILCYFAGLYDSKGDDWRNQWLMNSVDNLRSLKLEIQQKLKTTSTQDPVSLE